MANQKHLSIYLNDHLAATIAGRDLTRRSADANKGTPLGDFLQRLADETEEDQQTLERLMDDLGVTKNLLKDAAAWLAEKVGRLKLNGQLVGYSDLSRLIELDGISSGLEAKLSLWKSLKTISTQDPALHRMNFDELIRRTETQRRELEGFRVEVVQRALGDGAQVDVAPATRPT